jgi:hypothetical protein
MVHLNPHHLSDALQYLLLNLTERWLRWFPVRFAAITANCAASLVAFSTFRITTYFYCQLFFPLDHRLLDDRRSVYRGVLPRGRNWMFVEEARL